MRDPRFDPSHQQVFISNIVYHRCQLENVKVNEIEAGNGPFVIKSFLACETLFFKSMITLLDSRVAQVIRAAEFPIIFTNNRRNS